MTTEIKRIATMLNCSACKNWKKAEKGEAGWRNGLGQCMNVPNFYSVTQESPESDPCDGLGGGLELKEEEKHLKAFGLDGSGYQAHLLTAADFGCVAFTPKK